MKIIYITVTTLPWTSAHSKYVMDFAYYFGKRVESMKVIASKKLFDCDISKVYQQYDILANFKIMRLPNIYKMLWFWRSSPSTRFMLFNIILFPVLLFYKLYSKDVLFIVHNPITALLISLLKMDYVYDFHANQFNNKKTLKILQKKPPLLCIAQSYGLLKLVKSKFPKTKYILSRNAVKLEKYVIDNRYKMPKEYVDSFINIGYFGTVSKSRGVEILIEAFKELSAKMNNIHLWLVGNNIDISEKENYSNITFTGHLNTAQIIQIQLRMEILVATYTDLIPAVRYMSPMKVFEYLAAQKPILVPDYSTVREIDDGETFLYFDPKDRSSLKEQLNQLIINEELRNIYGLKSRKLSEKYTWETKSKNLYTEIKMACDKI